MKDKENIQTQEQTKAEDTAHIKVEAKPIEQPRPSDTEKKESATDTEKSASSEQAQPISKKKKKKKGLKLLRGKAQVYIKATYNNTIITVTDHNGNVICSSSAGKRGFKGPKKSTPYAAGVVVRSLIDKMKSFGIKDLDILVKGVGMGREASIRAFGAHGISVSTIKDITPIPHNGCRPKKPRRV